eukprot:7837411-Alexandrium_andersonii.AAC.1
MRQCCGSPCKRDCSLHDGRPCGQALRPRASSRSAKPESEHSGAATSKSRSAAASAWRNQAS